jgi:hypothetical protein
VLLAGRSALSPSRSIDDRGPSLKEIVSHNPGQYVLGAVLCCNSVSKSAHKHFTIVCTYPIPLINGVSGTLAVVLHRLDGSKTGASSTKHLVSLEVYSDAISALESVSYRDDDGVRQKSFERNRHLVSSAARAVFIGQEVEMVEVRIGREN